MLIALRSILFVLYLIVTVVPWGTAVVVCSLFLNSTQLYWMCANWLRVAIWGARLICGVRWRCSRSRRSDSARGHESPAALQRHERTRVMKIRFAWRVLQGPVMALTRKIQEYDRERESCCIRTGKVDESMQAKAIGRLFPRDPWRPGEVEIGHAFAVAGECVGRPVPAG